MENFEVSMHTNTEIRVLRAFDRSTAAVMEVFYLNDTAAIGIRPRVSLGLRHLKSGEALIAYTADILQEPTAPMAANQTSSLTAHP